MSKVRPSGPGLLPRGYSEIQDPLTTDEYLHDELGALFIMRCYFASYASANCTLWEKGMDAAVLVFGQSKGPRIAWLCLKVVRTMRTSRRSIFQFCNPFCTCCKNRLTRNEAHLMACIRAIRCGESGKLHLSAILVCEGYKDTSFIESLHLLTRELDQT